jgi:hypothetical protein
MSFLAELLASLLPAQRCVSTSELHVNQSARTLACCSARGASSVALDSASAFRASSTLRLRLSSLFLAILTSPSFCMILALQGWSSCCFSSICLVKPCVLSSWKSNGQLSREYHDMVKDKIYTFQAVHNFLEDFLLFAKACLQPVHFGLGVL